MQPANRSSHQVTPPIFPSRNGQKFHASPSSSNDTFVIGKLLRESLPERDRERWRTRLWLSLGLASLLIGLLLLPLLAGLAYYAYFQTFQRILPGVYTGTSHLGGLPLAEAAIALHKDWNLERRITVSDDIDAIAVTPATLGLNVDPLETARLAYEVGHNQGFPAEVEQLIYSLRNGWGIAPVVDWDPLAAKAGLEGLAVQISQAPVDATLRLEGADLVETPGKYGYTINIESTLEKIAADPLAVLLNGTLLVPLKPVLPRLNDVSAARAEVERLLSTPYSIRAYDPITDEVLELPISRETIASWLAIEGTVAGPEVRIDTGRVAATLTQLNETIGPERWIDIGRWSVPVAESARLGVAAAVQVNHHPTRYTVQPGDTLLKIGWNLGFPYWKLAQANPDLDEKGLSVGQELVVPSKDELLPLPIIPGKRILISISQQRMWIFENGSQIQEFVISTGIDRSPTQPGVFQVQTHEVNAYASVWDLYMPHFLGIYEAWPGFMNGIHGLPTLSNGRRLWANILGRPASYGCIILNLEAAEWLFGWAEAGVVVEIQP